MDSVECGAAALGIVLAYYGRRVPMEELRGVCAVSRDGSKASSMLQAARAYGLRARGLRMETDELAHLRLPLIVFWNFNHFLVVEGFARDRVYLNDPATGPRAVSAEEFDGAFTGIVLACEPSPAFRRGGPKQGLVGALARRMTGALPSVLYLSVAGLGLVGLGLVIPTFTRVFVDRILVERQAWVVPLLAGMALAAVLRGVLTALQRHCLLRLEARLAIGSASAFVWHLLQLPTEFFVQRYAGDISTRTAITDHVAQFLAGPLANVALNVAVLAFYALLMLQYDPILTALGVGIALLNVVALSYAARKRVDANLRAQVNKGQLAATTVIGLQTIETIKASGAESDFFARWAGFHAKVLNDHQRLGLVTQWTSVAPVLLGAINGAAILTLGGLRVMEGSLTVGTLVAFQSLMASFHRPVGQLVALGGAVQDVEGEMSRLDDVLRYPAAAPSAALPRPDVSPPARLLSGRMELRDVTFGYSHLDPPLVEGLNLTLEPGDRVALVGGSGSGKSTIARLVAGLYAPWSGEVLFDGVPRGAIPPAILARSVALVDQDSALFEGTVRENLTLWDATVPEADVVLAARDAAIHADIAARAGGYDHLIQEGGRNFSGGQRQRLEIARALANSPSLLVLDEATSSLDPLTEQAIDEALRHRGSTCLIVAHRLSTIRDCSEIVVLEGGRVVQRGTHDAMIKVDGPYARLIRTEELQAGQRRSVLERL
jgi:NHLM bacteriocin system ABC transporter peptidase/ATP-binding protein